MNLNTPLTIDDIDFRIQSINNGGYATILAYKDARVDMNRLDAVVGPEFWQRKHETINGKEFCSIGIYNKELKEWVWKSDCGTESLTEKEKGETSDAFKRAGFNWGIGRELYDYPAISVKLNPNEFEDNNGKKRQTWNLKLKDWKWSSEFKDGVLVSLSAVDEKGASRYSWKAGQNSNPSAPTNPQQNNQTAPTSTQNQQSTSQEKPWLNTGIKYDAVVKAIKEGRATMETIKEHYRVSKSIESQLQAVINEQLQNA